MVDFVNTPDYIIVCDSSDHNVTLGELRRGEDGFFVWHPPDTKPVGSYLLHAIADHLDKINARADNQ